MARALTARSLGRAVEEGLTYKFHAAWNSVLQLLCVFFEACGRQAHPVMKKVSWGAAGAGAGIGTWAFGLEGACVSVTSALKLRPPPQCPEQVPSTVPPGR